MRLQVSWTVLLVVIAATLGSKGFAVDNPWTAPALSQDPKVLLKASESFALNSKTGTTILLNQMSFRFEQDGRLHQSSHMIYRIDSNEAMQALSAVRAVWQPWHQLKPTIRARVITPTGDVHALDSSSLVDSPAFEQRPELFDDFRVVGAPLPAVSVGALVETEEVYEESRPAFAGGIVRTVYVGNLAPVENTRIEILAPSDLALRYELSDLPNAHVERTADAGQLHVTIVQGPLTAVESIPQFTPGDVALVPELSFSTGQSWKEVAFAYSALVEPQIRTGDVQSLVTPIAQANKDRVAVIRELMQKLHQEVRYTGVELGISSYVPQPTATVLSRHYGDCKDKAAVLAAMLRAAKIPAYLALLNPGRSEDVRPTLPGFGGFTHAIVYVPGTPDRWIDATDEYAEPDHLSAVDQGRLALIIRENTTELVKTPVSTFDQNVSINTREIDLEELGPAKGKEMFAGRGAFDEYFRRMCDLSDEKRLRETFLVQVKREFGADDVSDFHHSDARDLSKPIEVSLSMDKVPYATTTPQVAVVWMLPPPIRQWLPSPLFHDFSETGEDGEPKPSAPRTIDFVLPEAFVREWRYKLVAPPGYDVRSLPSGGTRQLGPAMLSESYEKQAEGTVVATMRFEMPKERLTPQEAKDVVKAVEELEKKPSKGAYFDNRAYVLLASGKVKEALAEDRRLIALHPKEALHRSELAFSLISVGLGEAARKEAAQAIALDPSSSFAWSSQGFVLEHDIIGREYHKGFDRAGAIKTYEKAVSIDPKDPISHFHLGVLHEYNDEGVRYAGGAEFDAALKEYRTLQDLPNKPWQF
jgi:transglutaminase-like putative cysteine protease